MKALASLAGTAFSIALLIAGTDAHPQNELPDNAGVDLTASQHIAR